MFSSFSLHIAVQPKVQQDYTNFLHPCKKGSVRRMESLPYRAIGRQTLRLAPVTAKLP